MQHEKPPGFRRRIPRHLHGVDRPRRSLYDTFVRALSVTSTMDAEKHSVLAYAFAVVFDVPQAKFEFALRRHKRAQSLRAAAEELEAKVQAASAR